jgi:hypothetical protein
MSANADILVAEGYHSHIKRDIYFNRQTKKVFSFEAVEDHDEAWLRQCLLESHDAQGWRFYFNGPVSEQLMAEIVKEIR